MRNGLIKGWVGLVIIEVDDVTKHDPFFKKIIHRG